jgi:hypothetical protein
MLVTRDTHKQHAQPRDGIALAVTYNQGTFSFGPPAILPPQPVTAITPVGEVAEESRRRDEDDD